MKPLSPENYLIRPFKTFKRHEYSLEYLINTSESFSVYEAEKPPIDWASTEDLGDLNFESKIFKRTLYQSVINEFYSYVSNNPATRRAASFDRKFDPTELDYFYVIGINQQAFGEQIKEGTFKLTINDSNDYISDDGNGVLLFNGNDASVVGNIFYGMGIIVISEIETPGGVDLSSAGIYLESSDTVGVEFRSQHTIYEHTAICTLEKGELNFSTNSSMNNEVQTDDGMKSLFDLLLEGSLSPYITTIGLYNDDNELVAIAKVPTPIKREPEVNQTFMIKFDI